MSSNAGENNYNENMKPIETGQQAFSMLIDDDAVYVDKTMYIYELLRMKNNFYFLSRPRRFGKSLFCSTLHAIFDGKRDLFNGL